MGEARARATGWLAERGVEDARREADLLLAHALGCDRLRLLMQLDRPISAEELGRARSLLQRRAAREPLAYIVGEREFYGRTFQVGKGCLVPRPETELLIDLARAWQREQVPTAPRIADVGTGSGALAVTLALELQGGTVEAVDLEADALHWAKRNAEHLGAGVLLEQGDGLAWLRQREPLHLIVSNPPYVDPSVGPTLSPEVRDWEPASALFAPAGDPHLWVRELCQIASEGALLPGGLLLVELGHDQGAAALDAARAAGLEARVEQDLEGLDRVLVARAPLG